MKEEKQIYNKSIEELYKELGTSIEGLNEEEALKRLQVNG